MVTLSGSCGSLRAVTIDLDKTKISWAGRQSESNISESLMPNVDIGGRLHGHDDGLIWNDPLVGGLVSPASELDVL